MSSQLVTKRGSGVDHIVHQYMVSFRSCKRIRHLARALGSESPSLACSSILFKSVMERWIWCSESMALDGRRRSLSVIVNAIPLLNQGNQGWVKDPPVEHTYTIERKISRSLLPMSIAAKNRTDLAILWFCMCDDDCQSLIIGVSWFSYEDDEEEIPRRLIMASRDQRSH